MAGPDPGGGRPGAPFPVLRDRSLNLGILLRKSEADRCSKKTSLPSFRSPRFSRGSSKSATTTQNTSSVRPAGRRNSHAPRRIVPGLFSRRLEGLPRHVTSMISTRTKLGPLETIQRRQRERGHAVRLEVSAQAPQELRTFLQHALDLEEDEVAT